MLAIETYDHGDSHSLAPTGDTNASLDNYIRKFVLENQNTLTETELARRLGISRKTLWEKRQRLGIPRKSRKKGPSENSIIQGP
jgi:DNA-binding NtrC family response regulator